MTKAVRYLSPKEMEEYFKSDIAAFKEKRGRAKQIYGACREVHRNILIGITSGYSTTKQDVECLDYIGRAIYLVKHQWFKLTEEELFYCALMGTDYDIVTETVKLGYFPGVFYSKQAKASSQKQYTRVKRIMFTELEKMFSSFFTKMANLASVHDLKDLNTKFTKISHEIKRYVGLSTFQKCETFFTRACILKVKQALEHVRNTQYKDALTIASAVGLRYEAHLSQVTRQVKKK